MTGAVFMQVLRRSFWPLVFWGLGAALIAWVMIIVVPNAESLQQIAKLAETFPPTLLQAFGGEDITFLGTPEGYLSLNLFSWLMPVLAGYSVLAGLGVTANEEELGTLDVLISLPLARWRIIVEKCLAYLVLIIGIVLLTLGGLLLGVAMTSGINYNLSRLVEGTLNMLPSLLVVGAFTVMISTIVRRRNVAAGLAIVFLIAGYFIDLVGRATKGTVLDSLRTLSFYTYHDNPSVMQQGPNWGNITLLLAVSVIMVIIALFAFERRDVGV